MESRLSLLVARFDDIRQSTETEFTEEAIVEALNELNMDAYKTVEDIPSRMVNEIFIKITDGKCRKLDPNAVQEVLDFIEDIQEKRAFNVLMAAKALRYLLRKDVSEKTALLVIDVQNDFISGSLALKNSPAHQDGEEVVDVINDITANHSFDFIAYSLDWHPDDHCSFVTNVSNFTLHETSPISAADAAIFSKVVYQINDAPIEQVLWPEHCKQGSEGAKLHERLNVVEGSATVYKGQKHHVDSYSMFWDNAKLSRTPLIASLLDNNITTVFVCGLALDFCVGFTSLDSAQHGFKTYVIEDACRGVAQESIDAMKKRMSNVKVNLISSEKIASLLAPS